MELNKNDLRLLKLFMVGKQSIAVDYKDTDELYIYPGVIHINNGSTNEIYELKETIEFNVGSLSATTWYYLMASAPNDGGLILSETEISVTDTVPELDRSKKGYYSNDGLSRCISFFYTTATPEIEAFKVADYVYSFDIQRTAYSGTCGSGYSARAMTYIPLVPITILGTVRMNDPGSSAYCHISSNGSTSTAVLLYVTKKVDSKFGNFDIIVDDTSKRLWFKNNVGSATFVIYNQGFLLPKTIFNNQ